MLNAGGEREHEREVLSGVPGGPGGTPGRCREAGEAVARHRGVDRLGPARRPGRRACRGGSRPGRPRSLGGLAGGGDVGRVLVDGDDPRRRRPAPPTRRRPRSRGRGCGDRRRGRACAARPPGEGRGRSAPRRSTGLAPGHRQRESFHRHGRQCAVSGAGGQERRGVAALRRRAATVLSLCAREGLRGAGGLRNCKTSPCFHARPEPSLNVVGSRRLLVVPSRSNSTDCSARSRCWRCGGTAAQGRPGRRPRRSPNAT